MIPPVDLVVVEVESDASECSVQHQQEEQDHLDEVLMLPAQPQCLVTTILHTKGSGCVAKLVAGETQLMRFRGDATTRLFACDLIAS